MPFLRLFEMQLMLDSSLICSIFVLMIQGEPLSATLPEDSGLDDRFWYWRGASGRRFIHSIYRPDLCPIVPGAVFIIVSVRSGVRRAVSIGRFAAEAKTPPAGQGDEEIHVHLLTRGEQAAKHVLDDLLAAMTQASPPRPEPRLQAKPVQLDLLAA